MSQYLFRFLADQIEQSGFAEEGGVLARVDRTQEGGGRRGGGCGCCCLFAVVSCSLWGWIGGACCAGAAGFGWLGVDDGLGDGVELFEDVESALLGGERAVFGLERGGGEGEDAGVEGVEILRGGFGRGGSVCSWCV